MIGEYSLEYYSTRLVNSVEFRLATLVVIRPGSSVGIATGYGLNGPGIEFR
jgi:hypothetical protein